MTDIVTPDGYSKDGRFMVFRGRMAMQRGIKIHVSTLPDFAQTVATLVLELLRGAGIQHKVFANSNTLQGRDEQSKKFITAYPQSTGELETCLEQIDSKLVHLCRDRHAKFPIGVNPISGDMAYGHSGYVFMRYGNFLADDPDDDRTTVHSRLIEYLTEDTDPFERSQRADVDLGDQSDWVSA